MGDSRSQREKSIELIKEGGKGYRLTTLGKTRRRAIDIENGKFRIEQFESHRRHFEGAK
jgi:hypothetical protein